MADTHLQINADGTTATRKTSLWPNSKPLQQEIIKSIFEQPNWHVVSINNINGSHWKIESECGAFSWKINLYISSIRDESRQPDEFKMQLGSTYPEKEEEGWVNLVLGIYTLEDGEHPIEYILSGYAIDRYDFSSNPSIRGTRTLGLQKAKVFGMYATDKSVLFRPEFLYYYIETQVGKQLQDGIENDESHINSKKLSLQQIYYGAPGTGKSHTINEKTEGESVIRTTFHPDSDYSTFVGAYKPTMKEVTMRDLSGHPVVEDGITLKEDKIIYEFVDQAFLQAYVKAWKYYAEDTDNPTKQYLIIEEINRGNCAQIFGDLFQLLDRNDQGFSVYPINADKDMKIQLAKAFKGLSIENAAAINIHYKGRDVVSEVLNGEVLLIPDNLYIWATMNTSDQSLFPIDSAFKRRWDWKYMPIGKGYDKHGEEIRWAIEGATQMYDWWSFLEKINAQIGEATQSEDKKLGFFFCKATNEEISAEKFVGKVIFYLWNDVFKNNGFEGPIFKDVDGTELSFGKFYKSDAKGNAVVQKDKVELFLNNLGVDVVGDVIDNNKDDDYDITTGESKSKNKNFELKVVLDGEPVEVSGDYVDVYLDTLRRIGLDKVMALNVQCYDQNILGLEVPEKHAYRRIENYYAITFKLSNHVERILSEIKEKLSLNMEIKFSGK